MLVVTVYCITDVIYQSNSEHLWLMYISEWFDEQKQPKVKYPERSDKRGTCAEDTCEHIKFHLNEQCLVIHFNEGHSPCL